MSKVINIRGDIITDDMAWIYDWFDEPYTSPKQVETALTEAIDAEDDVIVRINSGGGLVVAGMEIYSLLHGLDNVTVEITGIAASAASVIAEAGKTVKMHPVSMIMIHNVSGVFDGDYHDMKHAAGVLQDMNAAMAGAFVEKSGRSIDEVLSIMDKETWLTADQALEYGFADEIIHADVQAVNAYNGLSISPEQIAQAKAEKALKEKADADRAKEKARLEIELALI